jgi:hypothetical protein
MSGFRITPVGQLLTHWMVAALETVGVAPKGPTTKFTQDISLIHFF